MHEICNNKWKIFFPVKWQNTWLGLVDSLPPEETSEDSYNGAPIPRQPFREFSSPPRDPAPEKFKFTDQSRPGPTQATQASSSLSKTLNSSPKRIANPVSSADDGQNRTQNNKVAQRQEESVTQQPEKDVTTSTQAEEADFDDFLSSMLGSWMLICLGIIGNDVIRARCIVILVMRLMTATGCKLCTIIWWVQLWGCVAFSTKLCISRKSWAYDKSGSSRWTFLEFRDLELKISIGKQWVLLHTPT